MFGPPGMRRSSSLYLIGGGGIPPTFEDIPPTCVGIPPTFGIIPPTWARIPPTFQFIPPNPISKSQKKRAGLP